MPRLDIDTVSESGSEGENEAFRVKKNDVQMKLEPSEIFWTKIGSEIFLLCSCWTKCVLYVTGNCFGAFFPSGTFSVSGSEGHGGRVSINDVQEEVGWVVVRLAGVPWENKWQVT